MTPDEQWQPWIQRFRAGDPEVVRQFWDQYGPMLHRVAAKHLEGRLRRRVGPEDVVQSACRTFFRRAQGGQFELEDSEGLWRLLCAITLTKIREQARFHTRQKRGLDQEMPLAAGSGLDSTSGLDVVAPGPTPDEVVEFADHFEQLLTSLDDEERQIVDLKLQECTHEEVAEQLGLSERTVRRLFKRVQSKLGRAFGHLE